MTKALSPTGGKPVAEDLAVWKELLALGRALVQVPQAPAIGDDPKQGDLPERIFLEIQRGDDAFSCAPCSANQKKQVVHGGCLLHQAAEDFREARGEALGVRDKMEASWTKNLAEVGGSVIGWVEADAVDLNPVGASLGDSHLRVPYAVAAPILSSFLGLSIREKQQQASRLRPLGEETAGFSDVGAESRTALRPEIAKSAKHSVLIGLIESLDSTQLAVLCTASIEAVERMREVEGGQRLGEQDNRTLLFIENGALGRP